MTSLITTQLTIDIMMDSTMKITRYVNLFTLLCALVVSHSVLAQEVNLDTYKKCGDLICYQSLDDKNVWYYLPDQPRLAVKNGKPQFSFIKYVRNEKSGEAGTNRAQGGGIVHFLVTYGVDGKRQAAAEKMLKADNEDAKIEGPIIYRKGHFALITSFTEGNSTTTKTVAVGKAPLMEGQKAAVSMALTRDGAELLWESFKSDTPDISLVFDMEFAGIREPYEATLEADWSRVAKHHRIQVGGMYKWFGADVDLLFQELRQDGAVKITTKGESVLMDKIIESANAKLLQVMFDPNPTDELSQMAADKDSYSNLNQAAKMLKDSAAARNKLQSSMIPWWKGQVYSAADKILSLLVNQATADEQQKAISADDEAVMRKAKELNTEGVKLYDADKYPEAIEIFKKANALFKSVYGRPSIGVTYNLGQAYRHLGDHEQAIIWFKMVLKYLPQETDLRHKEKAAYSSVFIAKSLQALGKEDDALEYLHLAEKAHAGDTKGVVLIEIGKVYADMNKHCLAIESFKQATQFLAEFDTHGKEARKLYKDTITKAYNAARRIDNEARATGYPIKSSEKAYAAYNEFKGCAEPEGERAKEIDSRLAFLSKKLKDHGIDTSASSSTVANSTVEQSPSGDSKSTNASSSEKSGADTPKSTGNSGTSTGSSGAATTANPSGSSSTNQMATIAKALSGDAAKPTSSGTSSSSTTKATTPAKTTKKNTKGTAAKKRESGSPGFSLVASYKMKRVKRSGSMKYELNQYRSEMQAFAMAENIGSLFKKYGNDASIFRVVNLDDPVFKQREIMVTLDGQDATTFAQHVNYVTIQMRKKHESGELTTDELVITPEIFNESGNSFTLMYGYKGDDDREQWLNYDIRSTWSYHGGITIEMPWKEQNIAAVALKPPHRYRQLSIMGEGEMLDKEKVRHAVVSISTQLDNKPVKTQVTVKNSGVAPGALIDIPESSESEPAAVNISWYLRGGKKVEKSMLLEGDILYWDELPGEK